MSVLGVGITGWACLAGEGLEGFRARTELPERKHLKLMSPAVRLGVAAIGRALLARPGWQDVPAERRGLFVGTSAVAAPDDLEPALQIARDGGRLDLQRFGTDGLSRLHPLWLVKGLSNNIPGYACAYWDMRGPVGNRCEGRAGGLAAIVEAARAVAEGRVDLAVAGGADCVLPAPPWADGPTGEGAAFVVIERSRGRPIETVGLSMVQPASSRTRPDVDLGAATGAVALVRALERPDAVEVTAEDAQVGLRAVVRLGADGVLGRSPDE